MVLIFWAAVSSGSPYFLVDSQQEWQERLVTIPSMSRIEPMDSQSWFEYMQQLMTFPIEGQPYPTGTMFMPPELYVTPGGETEPERTRAWS